MSMGVGCGSIEIEPKNLRTTGDFGIATRAMVHLGQAPNLALVTYSPRLGHGSIEVGPRISALMNQGMGVRDKRLGCKGLEQGLDGLGLIRA